jgi:ArsR family transcriptional regulator
MESNAAISALSALAHESRLQAFRLLVRAGPEGIPAGEIAAQLGVAPPTLSFHLAHLVRAGLIDSRREGRSVLYALRVDGIRELVGFITQDCCQGRPELCAPEGALAQDCEACGP